MGSKKAKKLRQDPFIGSSAIVGLDETLFHDYLTEQEVALVMFYNPNCPKCHVSKPHFLKAAKSTKREGNGFAGVDCTLEHDLCRLENIRDLPTFKLYSRGKYISQDGPMMDYKKMRKFVEDVPSLPKGPGCIGKKMFVT